MQRNGRHGEGGHVDAGCLHEGKEVAEKGAKGPVGHQNAHDVDGNVEDGHDEVGEGEGANEKVGGGPLAPISTAPPPAEGHFADEEVAHQRDDHYEAVGEDDQGRVEVHLQVLVVDQVVVVVVGRPQHPLLQLLDGVLVADDLLLQRQVGLLGADLRHEELGHLRAA